MFAILCSLFSSIRQVIRSRAALQAEILALRHQLLVLHRANRDRKLSLNVADRLLWVWLSRLWSGWRSALLIVKPETVIAWHRRGFLFYWRWMVPTVFFRVLFVFVILSHQRRRPIHVAVTEYPTAEWVAHQLLEAFPWDRAPRYLLRDRDGSYGERFHEAANWLGMREVLTAPQSPLQNAYVERFIGSVRRGCLDHVIVVNETGLRRILKSYSEYYEQTRTHLSLSKDAPVSRPVQQHGKGRIVEIPQVGGLHHRYERIAA